MVRVGIDAESGEMDGILDAEFAGLTLKGWEVRSGADQ